MVGNCSRENGVLCTVAWSWLLFLHDEKVWKIFESSIVWGVDELYQTFWFRHFFNGKLQYSWFVECTDYIFMDWFARCHLWMNVWLKLTMEDFVWLLGSFVASCDIVFNLYAMLGSVFIKQPFFYERWLSFLLGWFVCSKFHGKHRGVLLSMLAVSTVASVLQGGFCVMIGCWGKLFGYFEGNFENTGRMEMFSCLEKVSLWSFLCLAKDEFKYHR